ncbi:2841_t:CDS:1 [Diversispora eburnea]|uniref:2841_t:CDS:1 n=1 Tax=Diversispora eburnea TaxID=1213867 RepID=A0A9N9AQZ1_9GLOM|nr:2841_t:CDS:1 [Diversispora eburnea]
MATKVSTEILIMILNNVQSTQDLHSSLLVNRYWCKVTIPILWKLPLGQEYCTNDKKLRKKALCIRTYLSCMNTSSRTLLTQFGLDLSSSPPQATFNYPSFTRKFIINNLVNFISLYSQQIIIGYNCTSNYKKSTRSKKIFREICKLIMNRCSFLDYFELASVPEKFSINYSDSINSIFKLPGAPKVFKKLESFIFEYYEGSFNELCEPLKLICDNILNMDLKLSSQDQVQPLARFINVQKRLENLSIVTNYLDCHLLLWGIISQKETLKSLRLESVGLNWKSSIGQFISLQELYIRNCGLHKSESLSFASSFTQLSSFHYFHSSNPYKYSQEFVIKVLETANTNLKNICLDLHPTITFDTFSAILNYCTKITKLTLYGLSPEQAITIFNNDFNELRRFSFDCRGEEFDANNLLCRMAKNVSESLENIEIRMGIFSADSLRKFFEGWCCKGRGGNKKFIVKRTELARLFILSNEHFKVIEEYGVQFDMERMSIENM